MTARDSQESEVATTPQAPQLPKELPLLPLKETVVFPQMIAPLVITRPELIKLVDDVAVGDKLLATVVVKEGADESSSDNLYKYGTACAILRMLKFPDGSTRIICQGLARVHILAFTQGQPYLKAHIETVAETEAAGEEVEALKVNVTNLFQRVVSMVPQLPEELVVAAMNIEEPGNLADLVASQMFLKITLAERQKVLQTVDVKERLQLVLEVLNKQVQLLELSEKIQSQVQSELSTRQREFYLREQLKAIQKELGEGDEQGVEARELKERIEKAGLPEEVRQEAERELDRLRHMHPAAAEYSVARTYIDWILSLPWQVTTVDNLRIKAAARVLDEDHYDLDKVKERILEYLAVKQLKPDMKGPILCFVGPPGTGKTSLGRSIARALGRKFVRLSLGGVRDEAEIRGHRRTYVGALPGRILQNLRRAGSRNPVFMLDEVDKLGADFRGDPSSALLEVLDPEQNFSFSDHYLEIPFDLSQVMFITTANILDTIPAALRDRMEVLELPGYTEEEKAHIAQRFLIPRQLEENGLGAGALSFVEAALKLIISDYTREAGVRNLEREIGNICRKLARTKAEGGEVPSAVTADQVEGFLGARKFFREVVERVSEPGVATGLAWTQAGGELLFIESTMMKGNRSLTLTGSLGEVMKESAQAALSYVRARAEKLGIETDFFDKNDIHIHVPAGQIKKDGPSAGITIATSLVSLLTGTPVKPTVAMTGEITLRGKVLSVGGIKEKVLAAKRAGIKTVILPRQNEKDLEELPEEARQQLVFNLVESVDEVLPLALSTHE